MIAYLFMTFGLLLFVLAGWYVVEATRFIAAIVSVLGIIFAAAGLLVLRRAR